jgi:hypothetical protein
MFYANASSENTHFPQKTAKAQKAKEHTLVG